jgi:MOSC domain-containing protein YiiM
MEHAQLETLQAAIEHVRAAPKDTGTVELIARRPAVGERERLEEAQLDPEQGLVGDSWSTRGSAPHRDMQLTLMNARVTALVAQVPERWALAGDQLYVDLDLSEANVPAGTRLRVGSAVIELSAEPHTGCGKFARRFGVDAVKFVNSTVGRELNMRGRNARIVSAGVVRAGDAIEKLSAERL